MQREQQAFLDKEKRDLEQLIRDIGRTVKIYAEIQFPKIKKNFNLEKFSKKERVGDDKPAFKQIEEIIRKLSADIKAAQDFGKTGAEGTDGDRSITPAAGDY
jgi:hypothetical protein